MLVGCSSKSAEGSPLMFTRDVCKEMADLNRRPVIMPLSQPAPDALPQVPLPLAAPRYWHRRAHVAP